MISADFITGLTAWTTGASDLTVARDVAVSGVTAAGLFAQSTAGGNLSGKGIAFSVSNGKGESVGELVTDAVAEAVVFEGLLDTESEGNGGKGS